AEVNAQIERLKAERDAELAELARVNALIEKTRDQTDWLRRESERMNAKAAELQAEDEAAMDEALREYGIDRKAPGWRNWIAARAYNLNSFCMAVRHDSQMALAAIINTFRG